MIKILVIEDESNTRSILVSVLQEHEYDCLEAPNGRVGIQIAQEFLPDLIICDIQMPQLDGYGVLENLSQNPATSDIPFIFLTGNHTPEDIRKGMNIGADDYLLKPFNVEDLLNAVRTRLKKKDAVREKYKIEIEKTKQEFAKTINFDRLTGLPNHRIFAERFQEILDTNSPECGVGILVIGIDRLRNVNEAFGHVGGDYVIVEVVQRLNRSLHSEDALFRGESDSFIILVPNLKRQEDVEDLAKKILFNVSKLFKYESHELHVTVSVGCSFCPSDNKDFKMSLSQAEMAIHHVQYGGGNGYQFYHPEMKKLARNRLTLESALVQAVLRKEFSVYYQPQVDIRTGEIKGMEALIRWQHPEFGMVPPSQFIPITEENGLIVEIGEWILHTACAQAKMWQNAGFHFLKLAVNISRRQLEPQNLLQIVNRVLDKTGFPPQCLELEITENLLIKNPASTTKQLNDLKAKGITIAIDDFGTGYSSLTYLRQFPINTLKLDQSFVRNMVTDASDLEIVSAVIKMAHTLKLKVVAEGVETKEQLNSLRALNCDEFQGFLFSRPVPQEEFRKLLGS